jgi:uncharacterized repeat protein (TIGR03803 family)
MRCKHILSLPTSRSALIGLLSGSAALAAVNLAHAQPLAPAATETVLYDFRGGTDGANPHAGLISDSKGVLYGTTWRGGGTGCVAGLGCGTVFKLTPPAPGQTKWTKRTLYRFKGGSDGEAPFAGLVLNSNGALFGTTLAGGGAFGSGTVFKLKPPSLRRRNGPKRFFIASRAPGTTATGLRQASSLTAKARSTAPRLEGVGLRTAARCSSSRRQRPG